MIINLLSYKRTYEHHFIIRRKRKTFVAIIKRCTFQTVFKNVSWKRWRDGVHAYKSLQADYNCRF